MALRFPETQPAVHFGTHTTSNDGRQQHTRRGRGATVPWALLAVPNQAESRGSRDSAWAFRVGAAGLRGSVLVRSVPRFHLGRVFAGASADAAYKLCAPHQLGQADLGVARCLCAVDDDLLCCMVAGTVHDSISAFVMCVSDGSSMMCRSPPVASSQLQLYNAVCFDPRLGPTGGLETGRLAGKLMLPLPHPLRLLEQAVSCCCSTGCPASARSRQRARHLKADIHILRHLSDACREQTLGGVALHHRLTLIWRFKAWRLRARLARERRASGSCCSAPRRNSCCSSSATLGRSWGSCRCSTACYSCQMPEAA